ncbi:MAG: HDOD domain-containing protein [Spirochaetales bacterium]|jgi:HD-like signal output (HDOD) protein|nr:HDOD domain-containing protein [Spirochaetales bacterium]
MANQRFIAAINSYIEKMPSLPTSVAKVLEVCNDPNASPADLNRIISIDPVLMGKVMKLINSAYYGLNQEITSLVRAIIMLGINTVKNLALSTAVLGTLGSALKSQALNMDGFWRHSLCVGVTAKLIATQRKIDKKVLEEYFIAGLLHDVGKIPLNNRLSEDYVHVMGLSDRESLPLYAAEGQILTMNHSDVGGIVVDNWKLSDEIHDAVCHHHALTTYEGEHKDLLYTVAMANYFANISEIGFSGDRYPETLDPSISEYLQITLTYLEDEMEDRVNAEIEKARIFLQVAS